MKTQAWGWLMAAVLAAGLNAHYHDGGLEWAHQIIGEVDHNAAAVLALASGNADQFLIQARHVVAHNETPSCPFEAALAQVESRMAESQAEFDSYDAMSARQQARLARLEANRERVQARLAAEASRFHFAMVDFNPADFSTIKTSSCPRVRVKVPRVPMVNVPSPMVHVDVPGPGPI
jgi:hypothetical protein